MYQQIGELIGNLIPFGIFLYLTLLVFGIVKTEKKPEILKNPSTFIKVVCILGLIVFAILIIMQLLK